MLTPNIKLSKFTLMLTLIVAIIAALLPQPRTPALADDACILPDVVYLGEGAGTYALPEGFDTLIVKRFRSFSFGTVDGDSITLTNADNGREPGQLARVWAMTGSDVPPAHFGEKVLLGEFVGGATVRTIMIDDDNDTRLTVVVNETESVYAILQPEMVQVIEFVAPHTGMYYADSADSIAIWPVCVSMPTPTPTASVTPTATATATFTATPGATPTQTATSTVTPAATLTVTPTPTQTATDTPIVTITPGVPTELTPEPEDGMHRVLMPMIHTGKVLLLGNGPNEP